MDDEFEFNDSRNGMQKVALVAIYDALTYRDMGLEINVEEIVSSLLEKPYEDCDYFVKASLVLTLKHLDQAIEAFNAKMRGWTFDRRNRVEQAILLLAYVHFFYVEPTVDKAVVINIALGQAHEYLGDKEYRFVNAILDNVLIHAA